MLDLRRFTHYIDLCIYRAYTHVHNQNIQVYMYSSEVVEAKTGVYSLCTDVY